MIAQAETPHVRCETPPVSLETGQSYQDDVCDVDQQIEVSPAPSAPVPVICGPM